MANFLDVRYLDIVNSCIEDGAFRKDRTGVGTRSIFGERIVHDHKQGFPLLTTKKVFWKGVVEELRWFLQGDVYAKTLSDKGVRIWDGDAERNGRDDTYLGPIYGYQWRKKSRYGVQKDQIKLLMEGLRSDPHGRRHLVSSWDVHQLDEMVLPPCHYAFQCYVTDEKIDLMWHQRSVDVFLGLPFNIASYGLLQRLIAYELGLEAGKLIGTLGDTHIYLNHIEQGKEQWSRTPLALPKLKINHSDIVKGEFDVELLDYRHHKAIKADINVGT